jgi:hypothetical protein
LQRSLASSRPHGAPAGDFIHLLGEFTRRTGQSIHTGSQKGPSQQHEMLCLPAGGQEPHPCGPTSARRLTRCGTLHLLEDGHVWQIPPQGQRGPAAMAS